MTFLTYEQVVEITEEDALADGLKILELADFPSTSWQDGSPELAFVRLRAKDVVASSRLAVYLKNQGFVDTAEGTALTRLGESHYARSKEPAVAAQRRITLACSADEGPYTIELGDQVLKHAKGQRYRNVEGLSVVYPATLTSGGTLTLIFEAEVAGAAANVPAGTVTILETTLAGVTVTVDLIERDGRDVESEPRYKENLKGQWARLPQLEPTEDSLKAVAIAAAPSVTKVAVDRVAPRGPGTVDVYLAYDDAAAGSADVDLVQAALDLRAFDDTTGAPNTRPYYAQAAPVVFLNITGTVYYSASVPLETVQLAVEAELEKYRRSIPLGGFDHSPGPSNYVPLTGLVHAIESATGVVAVQLTVPPSDLVVADFALVQRNNWALTYTVVNS